MERRVINPWTWQDGFAFVQANEVVDPKRVLVLAGQASTDADGQIVAPGDMRAQIAQCLDNIETVLREADFALADVVRINTYVTDVDAFLAAYDVFADRMKTGGCRPASALLGINRLALEGMVIEMEATAVR